MRESFVFHAEYIADLPDDYKADFAMYAINYALNDEQPPLMQGTLEYSLWAKIERRIDQEREKYERVKEKRAAAGRKHTGNQYNAPKAESPQVPEKETPAEVPAQGTETAKPAPKAEKPKAPQFVKPTVEEIDGYCKERRNGLDAQQFFDFYESKGWKVGAVKMKDWRACVRTWEKRHESERHKAGGMWGNENEVPEDIINSI